MEVSSWNDAWRADSAHIRKNHFSILNNPPSSLPTFQPVPCFPIIVNFPHHHQILSSTRDVKTRRGSRDATLHMLATPSDSVGQERKKPPLPHREKTPVCCACVRRLVNEWKGNGMIRNPPIRSTQSCFHPSLGPSTYVYFPVLNPPGGTWAHTCPAHPWT